MDVGFFGGKILHFLQSFALPFLTGILFIFKCLENICFQTRSYKSYEV